MKFVPVKDMQMASRNYTYKILSSRVDFDGWYKWNLERSDGKQIKVNKARLRQLRQQGKITDNQ